MPFDMLALLSLPAIILIGALTSYEDIKYGRIRNKWVMYSLAYSLAALLTVVVYLYAQNELVSRDYILRFFVNISFAALAGFLIWVSGMWSAGDAKLFIAYAALVPLSLYSNSSTTFFPSFAILAFTFIPLFAFYFVIVLLKTSRKFKLGVLMSMLRPKFLIENLLFIFAFAWLGLLFLDYVGKSIPIANNFFVVILFIFMVLFFFRNVLKADYRNASVIISIAAIVLGYERVFTMQFLKTLAILFILFLFIRYFMLNLSFGVFSYPLYIEDLKPGMVIAENYRIDRGRYRKDKVASFGFLSSLAGKPKAKFLFNSDSRGLSISDVRKIKRLHSSGIIKGHTIRIFQTVPFAPFMLLGVLLAIGTSMLPVF